MSRSSSIYLVTGAAGFIGSAFLRAAATRGVACLAVDRAGHFRARVHQHDLVYERIIDRDELFAELAGAPPRIDAVVHLGACSNTMETDPEVFRRQNTEYSQRLWQWCAERRVPLFYASSAATYGAGEAGYFDDEALIDRLRPLHLYGLSKQRFDRWALERERDGLCPPAWAGFKFFNVYGWGEHHKGPQSSVIFQAYRQIQESGRLRLFQSHRPGIAHGQQRRDFIFVDDVIAVLLYALEGGLQRGIYNLGTGRARSFLDLAQATFAALGREPAVDFIPTPESLRGQYQYFTEARMDKLRAAGYLAEFTPLETGVRQYVERLKRG